MNTSIRSLTLALTLAGASLLGTFGANAQTVINTLPYTITTKGSYVLNNDLSSTQTSGALIMINASNVSIDFQGHYISGPAGNTTQSTYGIYASDRSNLTIKNGTIAYCYCGIEIVGGSGAMSNNVDHQIDNMRLTYCYVYGTYILNALATRITNCQVSQGGISGANYAYGIYVFGAGTLVSNCVVNNLIATSTAGIEVGTGSFIRQNVVSNCTYGVYGGKYQDNLMAGCTYPYSGGIDAGGNN